MAGRRHRPARSRRRRPSGRSQRDGAIDRTQADWYKDAIIYQLHIKAFYDFQRRRHRRFRRPEAAARLHREPRRQRHLADAVLSLAAARRRLRHRRLPLDQPVLRRHARLPPLRRARRTGAASASSPSSSSTTPPTSIPGSSGRAARQPGSAARDYYVWSDTDRALPGDAHHLHRHGEIELDLGSGGAGLLLAPLLFAPAGPEFRQSARHGGGASRLMHYWLDMGVDGLQARRHPLSDRARRHQQREPAGDARRAEEASAPSMDAHYPDRMLLAEANQWPEDTRPYFGDGDECHMAFHFPLMPRMYMARGAGGPAPDHRHHPPDAGHSRTLPVGDLPPEPRRADARDGDRRGARLPLAHLRQGHARPHQSRHPPPACAAAWTTTGARSS